MGCPTPRHSLRRQSSPPLASSSPPSVQVSVLTAPEWPASAAVCFRRCARPASPSAAVWKRCGRWPKAAAPSSEARPASLSCNASSMLSEGRLSVAKVIIGLRRVQVAMAANCSATWWLRDARAAATYATRNAAVQLAGCGTAQRPIVYTPTVECASCRPGWLLGSNAPRQSTGGWRRRLSRLYYLPAVNSRAVSKRKAYRDGEAQPSFHSVLSIHNTATILGESKCVKRGPFRLRLVHSFEPMSSKSQDAPALIDEQPNGLGCSGHGLLEHRHRHIGTGTQHSHARQPTCGGHASGGTAARPQPQPSRRCCLKRAAQSALQQFKKAEPGRRHSALLACGSIKNNNPGEHPPDALTCTSTHTNQQRLQGRHSRVEQSRVE